MPTLKTRAGHGRVLPPTLTPVTTPTTMLFLTKLAASQAAGVAAIRLSLLSNGGHQVEELNSKGETIIGFILYPVGDPSTKKVTGVAVMQIGQSSRIPSPFTPAQRSAWGLIGNELKQFSASTPTPVQATAGGTGTKALDDSDGSFWRGVTVTTIDCGMAVVQQGLNPITDMACVRGVVAANWEINRPGDLPPDPSPPTDPDPIDDGTDQQTSQDGNSTGSDEGDDGGDPEGGGAGCFAEGTPVHVSDGGLIPIERIDIESKLLSCDTEAGKISIGTVTRLFKATSAEIITIVFGEEKLRCTPRHRFFTDSGWLAARHLSTGIKVRSLDGEMRPVLAISIEPAETLVFNMRVDSQHTYFVGETGYLVHNEKDTGGDDGDDGDDIPGSTEDKERGLKQKRPPVTPLTRRLKT